MRKKTITVMVLVAFFTTFCLATTALAGPYTAYSRSTRGYGYGGYGGYGYVPMPTETWGFGGRWEREETGPGAQIERGAEGVGKGFLYIAGGILLLREGPGIFRSIFSKGREETPSVVYLPEGAQGQADNQADNSAYYSNTTYSARPSAYRISSDAIVPGQVPNVKLATYPATPVHHQTISQDEQRGQPISLKELQERVGPSWGLITLHQDFSKENRHAVIQIDPGTLTAQKIHLSLLNPSTGVRLDPTKKHFLQICTFIADPIYGPQDSKSYEKIIEIDSKWKTDYYGWILELKTNKPGKFHK